jgi:hypothetical protein
MLKPLPIIGALLSAFAISGADARTAHGSDPIEITIRIHSGESEPDVNVSRSAAPVGSQPSTNTMLFSRADCALATRDAVRVARSAIREQRAVSHTTCQQVNSTSWSFSIQFDGASGGADTPADTVGNMSVRRRGAGGDGGQPSSNSCEQAMNAAADSLRRTFNGRFDVFTTSDCWNDQFTLTLVR